MPGVRTRADVHQNLDPVPPQQDGEVLGRMVGMPDCEHRSSALRRSLIADGYSTSVLASLRTYRITTPILLQRVLGSLRTFRIIAMAHSPQTFFREGSPPRGSPPETVLLCRRVGVSPGYPLRR